MADNSNFLVGTKWLSENLTNEDLVIVDCQWDTNAYIRAHIPGALTRPGHPYVKSEKNGELEKYLPTEPEFFDLIHKLGIKSDSTVVCYDEWDNHFATRLWWVLSYYGHENVKLLDGGWQAWISGGLPVSFSSPTHSELKDAFPVKESTEWKVGIQEVLDNHEKDTWQILDVRSDEEYNGVDRTNQRSGHIPNAIHLEWKRLLSPSPEDDGVNYFQSLDDMDALFSNAGIDKDKTIVVHCQSGVRASFTVFCMNMLGYPNVKLYDGSMGEWANRNDTPLDM